MGTNDTRPIRFRQSPNDFPLTVSLGEKGPSWGLRRWRGNSGLRFVPLDDEGYSIRGDKRQLLYHGRRRSHRFTILGDSSFEYDCVLNKEPEGNVIVLGMEGAENFDFFRQPDFVPDDFLKGSYAVYKRDTFIGEGTGKLCHIHRPEIIDSRGRRCWGELSIVGDRLFITIPEKWLGEASYPVIIDPTIGTTTVGSQYTRSDPPGSTPEPFYFDCAIALESLSSTVNLYGSCIGYAYTNSDDTDAGGRPVLYQVTGTQVYYKITGNEELMNFRVGPSHGAAGWRSASFDLLIEIARTNTFWFGISAEYMWYPRFDYTKSYGYIGYWNETTTPAFLSPPLSTHNYKLSMYFDCNLNYNYKRKLTQSIIFTDNRKMSMNIKRFLAQTAGVTSILGRFAAFYRKCVLVILPSVLLYRFGKFLNMIKENIEASFSINHPLEVIRKLHDIISIIDNQETTTLFYRSIYDTTVVSTMIRFSGEYLRKNTETVQAQGNVFRNLSILVRVITQLFVRDYILGRFLKARSELVIKSCVIREISLESRLA